MHLRGTEYEAFQRDRDLLDLQTPVLHGVLLGKRVDHLLDLIDLLLWRNAGHSQGISHASTFADGIRDTIEQAELRGQVVLLLAVLDQEARLVEVSDSLAVGALEILGDGHLPVVPGERGVRRSLLEVDVFNVVGALVAPVRDDRTSTELYPGQLLELVISLRVPLDVPDAVQTSRRRHELEDVVDGEGAPKLRLEGRSLEARPHLQANP